MEQTDKNKEIICDRCEKKGEAEVFMEGYFYICPHCKYWNPGLPEERMEIIVKKFKEALTQIGSN